MTQNEGLGGELSLPERGIDETMAEWTSRVNEERAMLATAAPPSPERVSLTDEQVFDLVPSTRFKSPSDVLWFARAIERKCAEAWGVKLEEQG